MGRHSKLISQRETLAKQAEVPTNLTTKTLEYDQHEWYRSHIGTNFWKPKEIGPDA